MPSFSKITPSGISFGKMPLGVCDPANSNIKSVLATACQHLNIIHRRRILPIRHAFHPQHIPHLQLHAPHRMPDRVVPMRPPRWKCPICCPRPGLLPIHCERKLARPLADRSTDSNIKPSHRTIPRPLRSAALRLRTRNSLAPRSILPRRHVNHRIARQPSVLRLQPPRKCPARPLSSAIPLNFRKYCTIASRHTIACPAWYSNLAPTSSNSAGSRPLQRRPLLDQLRCLFRSLVVAVVDVLNHSLARVQLVRVRHVVEKHQQIVRRRLQRLINLRHLGRILPRITRSSATLRSIPTPKWSARCHCPQPLFSLDSMFGP